MVFIKKIILFGLGLIYLLGNSELSNAQTTQDAYCTLNPTAPECTALAYCQTNPTSPGCTALSTFTPEKFDNIRQSLDQTNVQLQDLNKNSAEFNQQFKHLSESTDKILDPAYMGKLSFAIGFGTSAGLAAGGLAVEGLVSLASWTGKKIYDFFANTAQKEDFKKRLELMNQSMKDYQKLKDYRENLIGSVESMISFFTLANQISKSKNKSMGEFLSEFSQDKMLTAEATKLKYTKERETYLDDQETIKVSCLKIYGKLIDDYSREHTQWKEIRSHIDHGLGNLCNNLENTVIQLSKLEGSLIDMRTIILNARLPFEKDQNKKTLENLERLSQNMSNEERQKIYRQKVKGAEKIKEERLRLIELTRERFILNCVKQVASDKDLKKKFEIGFFNPSFKSVVIPFRSIEGVCEKIYENKLSDGKISGYDTKEKHDLKKKEVNEAYELAVESAKKDLMNVNYDDIPISPIEEQYIQNISSDYFNMIERDQACANFTGQKQGAQKRKISVINAEGKIEQQTYDPFTECSKAGSNIKIIRKLNDKVKSFCSKLN